MCYYSDMKRSFDFDEFFKYFLKYGNVKPYYVTDDGYMLGEYENKIRMKRIKLFPTQIEKLNHYNFYWGKRNLVSRTMERKNGFNFNLFLEHYKQYGNVKALFVCPDGYRLGNNILRIRGNTVRISEEQKQILSELGFKWEVNKRFDFDEFFKYFLKYHNVPINFVTPDGYRLGYMQNRIRNGSVHLTKEQTEKLNDAYFRWSKHRDAHTIEPIEN